MAQILSDDEMAIFDSGSLHHRQQMAVELFRQRIRRDARAALEAEERETSVSTSDFHRRLIYEPLPEASPELIPGLLPEKGTAGIVGETNTGKSLIACEIGSSLLTGAPLWGSIKPNRTIERVVYVLGEHTCTTIQGLFHRTKLPHEGKMELVGPEDLHPHKALVIGGVQQATAVDRMLKWTEGANLIVFDPLAGFVQGQQSEQDNSTMRTLIDTMSLIATKQGAACLILSHMGKPKLDEQGGEIRRTSYAMRGASAQEDALTHVFYLRKAITVKQGGDVEKFDLSIRKFKGNPSSEVFRLERDPVTKRNTLRETKASKIYPSIDEKMALIAKVQRVREENPKFSLETAKQLVATIEGLPLETIDRWLSGLI